MKRDAIRAALFALAACASTGAIAQDEADPPALDLSVPAERIHFASTDPGANYRNDPPGTWYGDHGGPSVPEETAADTANGDWQVHGAVEAGVGWSKGAGSSQWQAVNLNLDKTTTDDDGDTRHVNIDINVGRADGPAFGPGGYYGPGYYGPGAYGPGYYGPAEAPMPPPPGMPGRGPLVR